MKRRLFVSGLLAAPAIIRTPGLLMAIKPVAPWILRNQSPAEWLDDMIRESVQRPQRLRASIPFCMIEGIDGRISPEEITKDWTWHTHYPFARYDIPGFVLR